MDRSATIPHNSPLPRIHIGHRWRRFKIQLLNWEYWPVYIFNMPVLLIWLWNSLRSRDLFFFTMANPGIETGGLFGESKSKILRSIPECYRPKSVLWECPIMREEVEDLFTISGLSFPIVVKPDIGERGWLIAKINSMKELKDYVANHQINLILQPFIDAPIEASIMVHRFLEGGSGVTSICQKEFLHVTGDGKTTIGDLVLSKDRSFLQVEKIRKKYEARWYEVLPPDQTVILEPIGNHCRGTKFLNRNHLINEGITAVMTGILSSMPDIYYGRFDMKIDSWERLEQGKGLQILEFNGTGSDPAHIYSPGYSLIRAYIDIAKHWRIMARIARQVRQRGGRPVTLKKVLSDLIIYFRYKRTNT